MSPITISGTQQRRLDSGRIEPIWLLDIVPASGVPLYLSTNRSVTYNGHLYQPYLQAVGTTATLASYPEQNTSGKEVQLQIENAPIEIAGAFYPYVSRSFDDYPWELADASLRVLLTDGGSDFSTSDDAMPVVTSGVLGSPQAVNRAKFEIALAPRNIKLNDAIPMRAVNVSDFPEADRDALNGSTYIPYVVGSGVRSIAIPTGAGATTTTAEEASSGSLILVSEVTGFATGDEFFVGGYTSTEFTITAVDAENQSLAFTPDLSTLGITIPVGTVVRENKSNYDFTVANHECGEIREVYVTPRGKPDPVLLPTSAWDKRTVNDPKAVRGKRTDVRIEELFPLGTVQDQINQQPVASVVNGLHEHNVAVEQATTSIHFAGGTSPGGSSAINDGNEDTFYTVTAGNQVEWTNHPALDGTFVSQRYFAVVLNAVADGGWRMRRGIDTFLTVTVAHAKGEFRSTEDTGGDPTTDWNIVSDESATDVDVFEGWKEVTLNPSVTEDTMDLTETARDLDVQVSASDYEVGDKVEVVIDGAVGYIPDPEDSDFDEFPPVDSPSDVVQWFLKNVLGQTDSIIATDTLAASAEKYAENSIALNFVIQKPIKLDELFDQIAQNSNSMSWWGRDGYNLLYVDPDAPSLDTLRENERGVSSIGWDSAYTAADLRNRLTAYFGRDWTQSLTGDDGYRGHIEANHYPSQARFGTRGNEVSEGEGAFRFDMIADQAQALRVLYDTLEFKAYPRKVFSVETDWTYSTLKPGDLVTIDVDTLPSSVLARIMEAELDPRLLCRFKAVEVSPAAEVPFHANSVIAPTADAGGEQLSDLTIRDTGLANAWTLHFRHKARADFPPNSGEHFVFINPVNALQNQNGILVIFDTINKDLEVNIWNSTGALRKLWSFQLLGGQPIPGADYRQTGIWFETFVTWDGTSIRVWMGETGRAAEVPVFAKTFDQAVTQTNTDRAIRFARFSQGVFHNFAAWNRVLSDDEIRYVSEHKNQDLRIDAGDYAGASDLTLYFLFGSRGPDGGKNQVVGGTQFDLYSSGRINASHSIIDFP